MCVVCVPCVWRCVLCVCVVSARGVWWCVVVGGACVWRCVGAVWLYVWCGCMCIAVMCVLLMYARCGFVCGVGVVHALLLVVCWSYERGVVVCMLMSVG